jgi:hypothetical protein
VADHAGQLLMALFFVLADVGARGNSRSSRSSPLRRLTCFPSGPIFAEEVKTSDDSRLF